uniref:Uncharacterized protein n=1 Tax=Tetraselmis sp. GSL018 TaxID=582737 RepID=A0A061R0F3_9CHLO
MTHTSAGVSAFSLRLVSQLVSLTMADSNELRES